MDRDQFQRINKALADPRRFEILERIAAAGEVACATLADEFPVSQATISHHLKELANAGLVDVRREAKFGFFRLRRKIWSDYLAEIRRRVPSRARSGR
jgi:ArsR family transcriptional regulator